MAETIATPPVAIRYRAFLSYSHADASWAKWLHSALEGFRIDTDLVGRATPLGPVPPTLRPIFRDREDFSSGHDLTVATIAALDASSALIILCSTVAAARPLINEEVRLFRSRHPGRPVIPVIIDGEAPANFPPALRYAIASDGTITERPLTILGPDLRESGDGRQLGLAKAIAGLISVGSDEIFRRAARSRRRQARLRNGIIAIMVALAISGSFFAWRSHQTEQTLAEHQATLDEIESIVARYSVDGTGQAAGDKAGLTATITAIANGAATDARYAKALELIKIGKPAEAEPLLKAVADDRAARAESDAKHAAEAYRNLGNIVVYADPGRARDYLARALKFDPDHVLTLMQAGYFEVSAGNIDVAERYYRRALALKAGAPHDREIHLAHIGLGSILAKRGDLVGAKAEYQLALVAAEPMATTEPDQWGLSLADSHLRIGDVLMAQGDFVGALRSFRSNLAIVEQRLSKSPKDPNFQHRLSVSYGTMGNLMKAQGNPGEALQFHRQSQAIRERLVTMYPDNTLLQHDLQESHYMIGEVLLEQGSLAAALQSFRHSLAIAKRLTEADPKDANGQRHLWASYDKIGDVQLAQQDDGARQSFRTAFTIAERLVKSDSDNPRSQHDLATAYEKVGDMLIVERKRAEALASYQSSLAIRERLAAVDRDNAWLRFEIVTSHWRLATFGDEPARWWALVVGELRKLKDEGRLPPAWEARLPDAEKGLARVRGATVTVR